MNTIRQTKLNKVLEQILQILVTQYQPEKIILFGSLAKSEVREWSDLDLVIIKDTPIPFFQRLKEVALLCRPSVGADFLVYTPDEFKQMLAENNPFILEEVVRKGEILYSHPPPWFDKSILPY